jgi:hypothetical protein
VQYLSLLDERRELAGAAAVRGAQADTLPCSLGSLCTIVCILCLRLFATLNTYNLTSKLLLPCNPKQTLTDCCCFLLPPLHCCCCACLLSCRVHSQCPTPNQPLRPRPAGVVAALLPCCGLLNLAGTLHSSAAQRQGAAAAAAAAEWRLGCMG